MHVIPILSSTSVLDALPHLAGMVMVMLTLTILWGICAVTAKLVQILTPAPAAPQTNTTYPARPVSRTTPAEILPDVIPPELVAVIAAAVSVSTGQKVRIVSIKPISSQWERAGRQSVLTSHRIR